MACYVTKESNSTFNVVQIRDGPGPLSELIERFCGNLLPRTITSSANQMWVTFMSENGVTANTFTAVISGVPCKYTTHTILWI
jgi:cubilin